jgi:hypothetical protein
MFTSWTVHKLEELTAAELRRLLADGTPTVVVPFGSIEYQGAASGNPGRSRRGRGA